MNIEERRIQIAIAETLESQQITIAEWLNQSQFREYDRDDLISARKLKIWIKGPPKSRCPGETCTSRPFRFTRTCDIQGVIKEPLIVN